MTFRIQIQIVRTRKVAITPRSITAGVNTNAQPQVQIVKSKLSPWIP